MTAAQRNTKYYVVGGPLQPDRDCYVLRESDVRLYTRLSEGEYCHVLAPPQSGKTSLMATAASRMRADGVRVATVDLANISARDMAEDVGRWYYSVAYRICRELRIRFDMQQWWQERAGLTNMHRLREFFLDVVLAQTEERIVIFVDRIEAALGRPFAQALLTAIRACHDARATDPDYERLTFALFGSASVGQLVPGGDDSPFDVSVDIELNDFTLNEVRHLTPGLPCDPKTARQVTERVWHWTNGQPYLTQKLFRALVRQSGETLNDDLVDATARRLFVSRDGPQEDAHLTAIGKQLLRESSGKVARLTLYRRIRRGRRVAVDPGNDIHRDLLRTGIVVRDDTGRFALGNRVYEAAFTPPWVNQNRPFGWRGIATTAAAAILLVGLPIWYVQFLPAPYVRLLTESDQDYVTALEAYRRLDLWPGYGELADELFTDYLVTRSRSALSLREVQGFVDRLAEMPGRAELGEALLGEFWDRRAMRSMHRGDRDEALLYSLRALNTPTEKRRRVVAELLGDDYANLLGTIRTAVPLRALEVERSSGLLTALNENHQVEVWHVSENGPRRIQRVELLAEEVISLPRRLTYQGPAAGRALQLTVVTDHPRPADVEVELRAPSGRQVAVRLPAEPAEGGRYNFDSRRDASLAALLDENISGTWSANFTDTVQGVGGNLVEWSISIDGTRAEPSPGVVPETALIPEPRVARQFESVLSPGGRRALTWPSDPTARGDILVWNLSGGEILARIPRPPNFTAARFARGQSGVFITARNLAEIWDVDRVQKTGSLVIEPSFNPVLSGNGYVLVVDTVLEEGDDRLSIWDLDKPGEIGSLVTGTVADLVAVDSEGRYLAVSDGERLVRLWSIGDGKLIGEYDHASRPVNVRFDPSGRWLISDDAAHQLRVWEIGSGVEPVVTRRASGSWSVSSAEDLLLLGSLARGFDLLSLPRGEPLVQPLLHGVPVTRRADATFTAPIALAPTAGFAATYDGREAIKLWALPPLLAPEDDAATTAQQPPVVAASDAAAISRDGNRLAIATNVGDVRILSADQQALLLPTAGYSPGFIGHLERITRTVFDASGDLLASGSFDGSVRVWEAASGAPRSFFSNHSDGAVHDIAFTPDGRYVVSATRRSVLVTDAVTGEQLAETLIQSERPRLTTSADGERIYIAADRGGLTRWLWRGNVSEALIGPGSGITQVAVSVDESLIVTVDDRRRVSAWDAATMQARGDRFRAAAAVDDLFIMPDGARVLVQAGVWLNLLSLSSDGLSAQVTRRLPLPPTAIAPVDGGMLARVMTRPFASQPVVTDVTLPVPVSEPFENNPEQFAPVIESRLGLTLNDWGEPQPL